MRVMRRSGAIEVICGSMFSGKTEELIRRLKRALLARQKVQAFKPRVDDRYDAARIVSHGALSVEAIAVATSESLASRVAADTQVVGIDEAQFFDRDVVDVAEERREDLAASVDALDAIAAPLEGIVAYAVPKGW